MKHVPRDLGPAADASSGGGGPGLLRETLLLGSALLVITLTLWFGTGWVVELALPRVSVGLEKKIFGRFSPDRLPAAELLSAGLDTRRDRAAGVLARLAADPQVPRLDYRLVVVPGRAPNAFAFPGGTVGVTAGLLELTEDDVALAFVLGHELGHFAQRDHLRGIGRQLGRGLAWALIFGADGSDLLSSHLSTLLDLQHSRGQESSADIFGLELVHRIYGTTDGTDRLFAWLEQRDRQPAWLEMLQTHPEPAGRLNFLRERAARLSPPR
jgi:Zn-dependent protease with chaperone function